MALLSRSSALTLAFAACSSRRPETAALAVHDDVAATPTRGALGREDLPEGYVHVPNGVTVHKDCVFEIPKGGRVSARGDVTVNGVLVDHHDPCVHPIITAVRIDESARETERKAPQPNGWVEAAWMNAPATKQFVSMASELNVPPSPAKMLDTGVTVFGQLLYLFPSIMAPGAIVQPGAPVGYHEPTGGRDGHGRLRRSGRRVRGPMQRGAYRTRARTTRPLSP